MNVELFDEEFGHSTLEYENNTVLDEDVESVYNCHYITIHQDGAITDAWSDGPHPEKDTTDAICINERGGYQFRLILNGKLSEENPPIRTQDGILMYKWDGGRIIFRTEAEMEVDRGAIPTPPPSTQEQLRADVDFLFAIGGLLK